MGAPWSDNRLRYPITVGLTLILACGALGALVAARAVLLLGFLGVLIGALLTYPVNLLARRLPRGVAVVLTLFAFLAAAAAVTARVVPVLIQQVRSLLERIPAAIDPIERWWSRIAHSGQAPSEPLGRTLRARLAEQLAGLAPQALPLAEGVIAVVAGAVLVLALGFFLAHAPDGYHAGLRALVPAEREPLLEAVLRRLGTVLKHWMAGILASMTLMGALTALGLYLAGIEGWFTLAFLTFLGTFVPYAGALASAFPGLIAALAQSPTRFFYALLVYLGVHLVEGYIVEPMIMKRAVELRPALLLFWQLLMGSLFGVLGVIVATPLLACVQEAVRFLYVERHLGKQVIRSS